MAEEPPAEGGRSRIFTEVAFSIIQGPNLSEQTYYELVKVLVLNGGVEIPLVKDQHDIETVDLEEVTHIIAADIEFTDYPEIEGQKRHSQIEERMIPIVTPAWVIDSLKKRRLIHVRVYNPDPRFFFSGVNVHCADMPDGDKEAIYGGVMALGGQYSSSVTKMVTHLVAINMDDVSCQQVEAKKLNIKIVLPHWFDDCLKLNRRIHEQPYQLPNPDIEMKSATDPLPFDVKHKFLSQHKEAFKQDEPPNMRPGFRSFTGKRFLFAKDLVLSLHLREMLQEIIEAAGGEVVVDLESANVVLCQWREGPEYKYGCREKMDVGNLTWLYYMIAHATWTSPLRLLLHFPRPRKGIEGMENMAITLSNYGGDARLYLENLVEACGAKFTRTMKQENTHLITARDTSEKCKAAREWNIDMVNHLWIEETYANWAIMPLSLPRYSMFPRRTNLGQVVAQTRIELNPISFTWEDPEEESGPEGEETDDDLNMPDAGPEDDSRAGTTSTSSEDQLNKKTMPAPAKTPRTTGKAKVILAQTPIRSSTFNSPAMSSGSRRAKENAISKLHNSVMPDMMLFAKEQKRKGGVLRGGRRSKTPEQEKENGKNAKKRGHTEDDAMDVDEEEAAPKKPKKVPISVYLLMTAHQAWIDTPGKEDTDKKKLRSIGIQCIQNPEPQMTHLCAPSIVRTEKFVCALSYAPIVVNASWVEACFKAESIIDSKPYLLKDEAGEKKLNFNLADSLKCAKQNDNNLMDGCLVYLTEKVPGGFETMKKVIECNGGQVMLLKTPKKLVRMDGVQHLVVIGTPTEKTLFRGFDKIATGQGWEAKFYTTDWLLDMAMRQVLEWPEKFMIDIGKD